MGIWNLRSLNGREDEIIEKVKSYKLDYLRLTETKNKSKGLEELEDRYWLYWSAVEGNQW